MIENTMQGFDDIEACMSEIRQLVMECRENTDRDKLNFLIVDLRFKIANFRVYLARGMASSQSDRGERRMLFYEKCLSGIGFDLKVIEDNIKAADYSVGGGK